MITCNGAAAPLATVATARCGLGACRLEPAVDELHVVRAAAVPVLGCSSVSPVHKHPALRVQRLNNGSFAVGKHQPTRKMWRATAAAR